MPKIELLTILRLSNWLDNTLYRQYLVQFVYTVTTYILLASVCLAQGINEQSARQTTVVRAIAKAAPAVVNISGRKPANQPQQLLADNNPEVNGMGTGLIIDSRGYILTNHHVISGIDRIQVRLSRTADLDVKDFAAQIIAVDSQTDLAVIKIEGDVPFPVIELATSSDLLLGETVIAIGNAYGYEDTITKGIISCLQRQVQVTEEQVYQDLIQTDASINPGNSGGPLINIHGEAIGINVAVRVGALAIGFAIPMDRAMKVTNRILRQAAEQRIATGLELETQISDRTPEIYVSSVAPQSLAAKCGLRDGDCITHFGNSDISWASSFYINLLESGFTTSNISVKRDGEFMSLRFGMESDVPNQALASNRAWNELGIRVLPISFRNLPGKNKYEGGLKVLQVRNTGPASSEGIRAGDVLLAIHKWETLSLDNLEYILNSEVVASRRPVTFYIYRDSEFFFGEFFKAK